MARTWKTISTALLAAETGHLVFSHLAHSGRHPKPSSASSPSFPAAPSKNRFVCQLAATLKAVVSQRLVRRADDKGRVPACEVMITTAYIRDCII